MSGPVLEAGDVERLVAHALAQCRTACAVLDETVIPNQHPLRRTFAQRVCRKAARSEVFGEDFIRDLEVLRDEVRREAATGLHVGWQADPDHVRGGWEVVDCDPGSAELDAAARALADLASAVGRALDAARAARIAGDLVNA